jgi:hypothetical protein
VVILVGDLMMMVRVVLMIIGRSDNDDNGEKDNDDNGEKDNDDDGER